jgi:hypothetical protein
VTDAAGRPRTEDEQGEQSLWAVNSRISCDLSRTEHEQSTWRCLVLKCPLVTRERLHGLFPSCYTIRPPQNNSSGNSATKFQRATVIKAPVSRFSLLQKFEHIYNQIQPGLTLRPLVLI